MLKDSAWFFFFSCGEKISSIDFNSSSPFNYPLSTPLIGFSFGGAFIRTCHLAQSYTSFSTSFHNFTLETNNLECGPQAAQRTPRAFEGVGLSSAGVIYLLTATPPPAYSTPYTPGGAFNSPARRTHMQRY